jgi:hypothetical protein
MSAGSGASSTTVEEEAAAAQFRAGREQRIKIAGVIAQAVNADFEHPITLGVLARDGFRVGDYLHEPLQVDKMVPIYRLCGDKKPICYAQFADLHKTAKIFKPKGTEVMTRQCGDGMSAPRMQWQVDLHRHQYARAQLEMAAVTGLELEVFADQGVPQGSYRESRFVADHLDRTYGPDCDDLDLLVMRTLKQNMLNKSAFPHQPWLPLISQPPAGTLPMRDRRDLRRIIPQYRMSEDGAMYHQARSPTAGVRSNRTPSTGRVALSSFAGTSVSARSGTPTMTRRAARSTSTNGTCMWRSHARSASSKQRRR